MVGLMGNSCYKCKSNQCSQDDFVWSTSQESKIDTINAQHQARFPEICKAVCSKHGLPHDTIKYDMAPDGTPQMDFRTPKDWSDEKLMAFIEDIEASAKREGVELA